MPIYTQQGLKESVSQNLPSNSKVRMLVLRSILNQLIEAIFQVSLTNATKLIYPYGEIVVKKAEHADPNNDELEPGDYVVNTVLADGKFLKYGKYVSGDPLSIGSYDIDATDYYDPEL